MMQRQPCHPERSEGSRAFEGPRSFASLRMTTLPLSLPLHLCASDFHLWQYFLLCVCSLRLRGSAVAFSLLHWLGGRPGAARVVADVDAVVGDGEVQSRRAADGLQGLLDGRVVDD